MRIWDLPAGYLNRQSLLGEHRELHGLFRIHRFGLSGYARHPETVRWRRCLSGLCERHHLLVAEMALRGYVDRTPLVSRAREPRWPASYVDEPARQLDLLRQKYVGREGGRIPLPRSPQDLWAQHKYSVMARDPDTYASIGRRVARLRRGAALDGLALELTTLLRQRPDRRRAGNAIEHMWGYVSKLADAERRAAAMSGPARMLRVTQELALRERQPFLLASTALSELAIIFETPRAA